MDTYFCTDATPVFFNLFDFSIAPPLLYYAYIPIVIFTLIFSLFALWSSRGDTKTKYLALLSCTLLFYVIGTLLTWVAAPVPMVMFGWEMWSLTTCLLFMATAFFMHSIVYEEVHPWAKVLLLTAMLPVIVFTPTSLNIESFDLSNCEGWITTIALYYTYFYCSLCITVLVGLFAWITIGKHPTVLPKKFVFITFAGAIFFLSSFLITFILGDLLYYEMEIIGPVGAVIFLVTTAYTAINYRRFNFSILGSEFLIVGLAFIVGSIVFVQSLLYVRYVAFGTLILVLFIGYILVQSIKRDAQQKKEIEALAKKLEHANKRLRQLDQMKSEFVSIASHQLRSPLTSIRGYASMLLEGTYGKLPPKAHETLQKIADSSRFMAMSVEDYLNVSRIESGNMKYNLSDFNLKDLAEKVADELRQEAIKKGLLLTFKSDISSRGIVHADIGKVRQVIQNLVDNSMKYTPRGSVEVRTYDDKKKKKIYVSITDTGIGMSAHTLHAIFDKFERAHNANNVNVTGTGLGLYVAKKMVEAMGGTIEAHSEGEGKGSTFTIEFPLAL